MYQKFQFKIQLAEEALKAKVQANPSGFYFFLKTKLLFYNLFFELVKYFILLFKDPAESFIVFKNQGQTILGICPYSYYEYRDMHKRVKIFSFGGAATIVLAAVITSLITNLFFGSWFVTKAATYTFTQTDWNTLSSNTAAHASDQSNWTQYSATSTYVTASSSVMLTTQNNTWTVTDDGTTDTGFNNAGAATSSAVVSGTGSGAGVVLSGTAADSGNGDDGSIDLSLGSASGGCTGTGLSWSGSTCTIQSATKTIFNFTTVNIPSNTILTANGTAAITLKATGNVTIGGTVNLNGADGTTGSPGGAGGAGASSGGTGGSGEGTGSRVGNGSGGGGAAAGGGHGGSGGNSALGSGGGTYDSENIGGSGGGSTNGGGSGGGGGGSIVITSSTTITINSTGIIKANGGAGGVGGGAFGYGGGGGSGGRIALTASTISNSGSIQVIGGVGGASAAGNGSGGGGGGGGRIILKDGDGSVSGTVLVTGGAGGSGFSGNGSTGNDGAVSVSGGVYSSGTFTSHAYNTTGDLTYGTLSWTATTPSGTSITIKARSGNQSNLSDATAWGSCTNITSGSALSTGGCVTNGHQYIQFQATLSTTDITQTPTLSDVSITYTNYPTTAQTLTSSGYDTSSAANLVAKVAWTATTPSGTTVQLQMRSATTSADLAWHNWCGYEDTEANCNGGYYFTSTSSNVSLPSTHTLKSAGAGSPAQDDRWYQYKILFYASPTSTPVVSDVTITYAVNARPDFDMTYGTRGITVNSQASDSTFSISYKIRDMDSSQSTNGSPGPGYVTPSFEYSTNGGSNWTTITGGLSALATTSKAVDTSGGCTDNCATYTTHTITWSPTSTPNLLGTYTTTAQIKITIDDGEAANNSTSTTSALFTLDTKNPATSTNPILVQATTTPAIISLSATDDSTLYMKIGLNSDLSDNANWIAYANSTTTRLSTDPDTVYVQFKDEYGNTTAIASVASPETPQNFIAQDISNLSSQEYRMFVAWKLSTIPSFGSYRVYRSTDGGTNYSLLATITDINTNYYINTGLTASSTYYYKVSAMDSNGNGSYFSSAIQTIANGAQDAGEGGGGSPEDAPTISSISSGNTTPQSTVIAWTTNKLSNSKVSYCSPATCTNYASSASVNSYVSSHSVAVGNLTPNTTYSFVVTSIDPFGNAATSSNGTTFTASAGPKITNVSVIDLTERSAKINWDTNVSSSNNTVVYSVTSPPSGSQAADDAASTNRTVVLSGLSMSTTYYFYPKSQNSDSNWGYDYNVSSGLTNYYSFTTPNDANAPTISNITATSTTDSVSVISWTTNEEATSQVEYGLASGNYTSISYLNSNLDITHFFKLTGLSAATTYYYRAGSVDGSGNSASSSEQTFATLTERIARSEAYQYVGGGSGGGRGNVSSSAYQAEVEQKEKLAQELKELQQKTEGKELVSKTEYEALKKTRAEQKTEEPGQPAAEQNSADKAEELALKEAELKQRESAIKKMEEELFGLTQAVTDKPEELIKLLMVKFKSAMAKFSGNVTISPETEQAVSEGVESLSELAKFVMPPVLMGAPQVEASANSAVMSWKTDKESNSLVAYASQEKYNPNNKESTYSAEAGNLEEMVRDHKVAIYGLIPSTLYHYKLKSKAKLGKYAESPDFTFMTKSETPIIANAAVRRLDDYSASVSWNTNIPTDALVKYTPMVGGLPKLELAKTLGKPDFILSHKIDLKNLEPATTYKLEIESRDAYGNFDEEDIESFSTTKDTVAPKISQIKTEMTIFPGKQEKVQALVFWTTDEPATSKIIYAEGPPISGKETVFLSETETDQTLKTDHAMIITKWLPGTVYRYRAVSSDSFGNEGRSEEFTTMTPKKRENVIDIIIDNFSQTFGWTKRLGF